MLLPIDPDDLSSWPERLKRVAQGAPFSGDQEDWRVLFEGRPLRTYHAARLLPHEVEAIKRNGLKILSRQLLEQRLTQAQELGYLDSKLAGWIRSRHVFAQGREGYRAGKVYSILGRQDLNSRSALDGLICHWGGEAMHGHDKETKRQLSNIGTPSLVILDQVIGGSVRIFSPDEAFREFWQGADKTGRDVSSAADIKATDIVDVVNVSEPASLELFPELQWLLTTQHNMDDRFRNDARKRGWLPTCPFCRLPTQDCSDEADH